MPMFYTPKPRQFHYRPRFYDPKREEWDKLKEKYHLDETVASDETVAEVPASSDEELAYFQQRVRTLDREDREAKRKLTLKDFFRKREKPQFHYVSRFDAEGNLLETPATATSEATVKRRIRRRFEDDDEMGLKPIPAGKIMIYALIVFLLLLFIFGNDLPFGVRGE